MLLPEDSLAQVPPCLPFRRGEYRRFNSCVVRRTSSALTAWSPRTLLPFIFILGLKLSVLEQRALVANRYYLRRPIRVITLKTYLK